MDLQPGAEVLHYRIVEKLGEGGMGVVWKAVDTTLERPVAIKLLPERLAADTERLGRFEREAKTLASLHHPHIAGIYGFHEFDGTRFLAMEYVEGEDLAQRLKRGAIPLDEAVGNARAVAPDGSSGSQSLSASMSPTVTSFGTAAHVILGTAAYMAPEQARGKPVDRRADVWALGALLFEMLTGSSAFGGETISDTLASVLKTEPDWDELPAGTPAGVRRLLRRCLQKDPKHRLHDAADARIELEQAFDEADPVGTAGEALAARRPWGLVALVAVAALIAGLSTGYLLRGDVSASHPTEASRVTSAILFPDEVTLDQDQISLAVSPDGGRLAFIGLDREGVARLYVHDLATAETKRLPQTEQARTPFWSPDGKEVGYFTDTRLERIAVAGGTPLLADRERESGSVDPRPRVG